MFRCQRKGGGFKPHYSLQIYMENKDKQIDWKERYYEAEAAFHKLKSMTKKVPAGEQTPEYRELANRIHELGREVFTVIESDLGE